MYYIYGRVRAIPTYRVYRLYDIYIYYIVYILCIQSLLLYSQMEVHMQLDWVLLE